MNNLIKILFNPRFKIEEMEQSHQVHGYNYKISEMFFDNGERNCPSKSLGIVNDLTKRQAIEVIWNQFGECMADGKREKRYDMVRPTGCELVI